MKTEFVVLDHGSGGEASQELIHDLFLHRLDNRYLRKLDDSAVVQIPSGRLAMTTDSYVVDPIFFPGGNIGSLAVHGTVNDLAMQGAEPRFLTLGLIIEEGLEIVQLGLIVDAIAAAARDAGVQIVAGDTKVVPRGHADKIFINTAGIGVVPDTVYVGSDNARSGDAIIISGTIGDHGIAILTRREGLQLKADLRSDSANLNGLASSILAAGSDVHVLRDPTRGGVATALNEVARQSRVGVTIFENHLPITKPVRAAAEILGLDPLYVANEGKCLVLLPKDQAPGVLATMRHHKAGRRAAVIGEVTRDNPGRVMLQTTVGGTRILSMLRGEQLPRIC